MHASFARCAHASSFVHARCLHQHAASNGGKCPLCPNTPSPLEVLPRTKWGVGDINNAVSVVRLRTDYAAGLERLEKRRVAASAAERAAGEVSAVAAGRSSGSEETGSASPAGGERASRIQRLLSGISGTRRLLTNAPSSLLGAIQGRRAGAPGPDPHDQGGDLEEPLLLHRVEVPRPSGLPGMLPID